MMQRALVTGAGGFLGRAIVAGLTDQGIAVRGFSRGRYPALEAAGVQWIQGDLRNERAVAGACRDIDTVFHVAARAGIWGPWESYHAINTLGTQWLLNDARTHGVQRFIYTSSPSVTFSGMPQCGVDESDPYPSRWLCHYPHTKALAEQSVLAANGRDGLLTCALRPHLIWGPGDPHLIPRLVDRARQGKLRRVGSGKNLVDITYIDNAAEAHLLAAARLTPGSPVAGKAYFISQGQPVNCWSWINEVLALAGVAPVTRAISYRAAWWMGGALEGLSWALRQRTEPPMTRFLASQLATSHYFDITAARRDLGYAPRVSTEEGMRRLAAAWRVAGGEG
jgi:2-alkyl-3-oxoalkanoate reductase